MWGEREGGSDKVRLGARLVHWPHALFSTFIHPRPKRDAFSYPTQHSGTVSCAAIGSSPHFIHLHAQCGNSVGLGGLYRGN